MEPESKSNEEKGFSYPRRKNSPGTPEYLYETIVKTLSQSFQSKKKL